MAQVILNRQKSTRSSPNIWYTVTVEPSERTLDSVTLKVTVESDLEYDSSNKGTGYTMTGELYIGNTWRQILLKESNETWVGSKDPYTDTVTFVISGLSAAQTALSDILFLVVSSNTNFNGGTLDATDCADIEIERYGGIGYVGDDAALCWVNNAGEWQNTLPWVNDNGTWKVGV